MTTSKLKTIHRHNNCVICGKRNLLSIKLNFISSEDSSVYAIFKSHDGLQGYDGYLHGGVISTLLDSAMTHCLFHNGVIAVTGDLRIRFLHLVPCDTDLTIRAKIKVIKCRAYIVTAELLKDERVLTKAEAKFMQYCG